MSKKAHNPSLQQEYLLIVSFKHTSNLLPNKKPTTLSITQISGHHNHPLCWIVINVKREKNQRNKKLTNQTKKNPPQPKLEGYTDQNKSI